MKRLHPFLVVTGVAGLLANALAVLSYLTGRGALAAWSPDPGLAVVLIAVLLAYSLAVWSALVWRWTEGRLHAAAPGSRRAALLLLNGLAAFPLLTFWLDRLFSLVLYADLPSAQRWLLALLHATLATPLAALTAVAVGQVFGPLLDRPR